MNRIKLIRHFKYRGALLIKNRRPINDIFGMPEFVRSNADEHYDLLGYVFDRPILIKRKKGQCH